MRLSSFILVACALAPAATLAADAASLVARGDAQRKAGDYDAALATYEEARAAGGGAQAEVEKRIGWTLKALRRFAAAERALVQATRLDPADREAQDDLASLRRGRGLRLSGWLGGDEPGTSKQAVNLEAWYGGLDRLEVKAGYGYSDAIFYSSQKGFASAYWFYAADSYAKVDLSLRKYDYSGASRPVPDSNAYEIVPRGEVEVSHWIAGRVRAGIAYQIFLPNFFFDTSERFANHKVTGEVEVKLAPGLVLFGTAALLRDPDPKRTAVKNRPLPGAPPGTVCVAGVPDPLCASRSDVVFRTEDLFGAGLQYEAERWGAGARWLQNRDLDAGFDWSILTSFDVRPVERLSLSLSWTFDRYSTAAGPLFAGKDGHIWWGSARYQFTPSLALGGGLKWVKNPGPASTGPTPSARNDPTLLLNLEYRSGIF